MLTMEDMQILKNIDSMVAHATEMANDGDVDVSVKIVEEAQKCFDEHFDDKRGDLIKYIQDGSAVILIPAKNIYPSILNLK